MTSQPHKTAGATARGLQRVEDAHFGIWSRVDDRIADHPRGQVVPLAAATSRRDLRHSLVMAGAAAMTVP